MYAADVVTFLKPEHLDLISCAALVDAFGKVSGLHTNRDKCSVHPIPCSPDQVELAHSII
jgi:hypothetical protein